MAKAKAKPAANPDDSAETVTQTGIDMEDVYSAEPLNAALSSLFAEMGIDGQTESFVTVHKVQPETGKEARVWKDTVDKYDLDQIAKRFGSGEYTVRVYVQRDTGQYSCRGSKTFHMLLDPVEDANLKAIREGRATPQAPAPVQQGMSMAEILALMQSSQNNLIALLQPIIQGSQGSKQNTLQELKGLAETFGMMPNKGAGADPMQMFTMFSKFMELTKNLTPEKPLAEDEIGPNSMLLKGMELFGEAMKGARANAGTPQLPMQGQLESMQMSPIPTLAPTPSIQPKQPVVQNNAQSAEDAEMQLFLKMQLAMMLRAAANDSDVETYAALIFEQAPDEIIENLRGLDWFVKLNELEPKCAAYQMWFEKLRNRVVEMLEEDAQEDIESRIQHDATLTQAANATSVAGDAKPKSAT